MKIELWDISGAGIIFPENTGMIWTNQCGGTCCSHPEIEGFFIPLNVGPEGYGEDLWIDAWPMSFRNYEQEISKVEQIFGFLERITKEEFDNLIGHSKWKPDWSDEEMYGCGEAWIPVKIKQWEQLPVQLNELIGKIDILTYPNSD